MASCASGCNRVVLPLASAMPVHPTSAEPPVVDVKLYALNRKRLVEKLADAPPRTIVLLEGGKTPYRYDTDREELFRQESNFHWAFGVKEPDCYGAIDLSNNRSILFVPRLTPEYGIWMGHIRSPAEWRDLYEVDEVMYDDQLTEYFKDAVGDNSAPDAGVILTVFGRNTDSGRDSTPATFTGIEKFNVDRTTLLHTAISSLRAIKTPLELQMLRYSSLVTSEAHLAVVSQTRPNLKEYQMESVFQHWCYYHGGARYLSYTCICCSGENGAILHYGHAGEPNAKTMREDDMCLFDMGCEYNCYGADVTTSFPANGKFTDDQKLVYNAVLAAQHAVMDAMRPGVSWVDMHALSYRVILTQLRDGGVLTGDVDAMMEANLGAVFMPHGLGHMLGIDVHDVGGYLRDEPGRPTKEGFAKLRTARMLKAGMFLTVEPGCYFINYLLDRALANPAQAHFFVPDVLARFRKFGGVRIEDDVLVTETGIENFSCAPRTIEDLEAAAAGRIHTVRDLTTFHYHADFDAAHFTVAADCGDECCDAHDCADAAADATTGAGVGCGCSSATATA